MQLSISIENLDAIRRAMSNFPGEAQRELLAACQQSALLLQREWMERMPRGATGLTAGSIQTDAKETATGAMGMVGSTQPAVAFVELGTRPHMPPYKALVPWVRAVLGVQEPRELERTAYLVARKIAREGTPAQHPMQHAFDACRAQIEGFFATAAQRLASLQGGAA